MHLKRVDLVGFKSFAASTTFAFEPGISVLCGPNGSGKSNVADAVRWALGEQSVRAIRGRRGEDVIFVGSQGRQPLGLSEVSLTLDNADGRIPLDYDEVRITRRLYRSGEAEYLANGSRVRLKDIHGWLLHAALDPDAYVVVGQGSVDALILQRAEERRAVLENAADIRRHHVKLAETRSRLAETEANLLRCRAVIAELEPHVARLRSQAERAGRYHACREELSGLASRWFRHALARGRAELQRAAVDAAAVRAEVERLERASGELEASARAADARATAAEEELSRREPMLAAARAEQARIAAEAAVAEERRRAALGSAATLQRQLAELGRRAETLEAEVAGLDEQVMMGQADLERAEEELLARAPARPDDHEAGEAERVLSALRGRVAELEGAVSAGRAALTEADSRLERAEQRRERLTALLARLEPELVAARCRAESARAEAERWRAEAAALRARRDALAATRADAQRALDDLRTERQRLAGERERLQIRREATEIGAGGHGGSGARVLLEGRLSGARGLVGGELRVPAELQAAVSAALGESAHTVVVEEDGAALAGLRLLEAEQAERAGIVSMRGATDAPSNGLASRFQIVAGPLLADLDVHGFADQLVASDTALDGVRVRYLAFAVVAPTLELAREAARRLSDSEAAQFPWQVVTTDGRAIRWNGEWRGGRDPAAERLVARRQELAGLDARLGAIDGALAEVSRKLAELEQRCAALDAEEAELRRDSKVAEAAEREAAGAADADDARVGRARREVEGVRSAAPDAASEAAHCADQARELAARVVAANEALARASGALPQAEARAAALRAAVEAGRAARAERRADLGGRRSALQGRRALLDRSREDLARTLRATEETQGRLTTEHQSEQAQTAVLGELSARCVQANDRVEELDRSCDALRAARRRTRDERADLEQRAAELRAATRAQRTVLEAHSIDESRASDRLERVRREAEEYLEDLGVGVDRSGGGAWEQGRLDELADGGAAGETPPADLEPAIPDPDALRRRMNALRRELRAIGPVGDDTLAEFGELRDRHAFLVGQTADLDATVGELRGAMGELEGMMRTAFDDAFARVNAAFGEYFGRLFGGGHAELVLSRPDDVLETGVDIVARPPGKRLQPLVSLSGGERALTMVALIFGLLKTNPAPFCVLDEVDAALDDANVRRFTDMLQELSERTQFIVVTHNRATMEIAQALYGISMGADGVSTVVSLRLPS